MGQYSAKYLGIKILTGSKFKCCFAKIKSKFYRSANAILGKINCHDNAIVSVNLVSSIALPVLMYSTEALGLNKSEVNILDHPWSRIFEKIFGTFDKNIVKQCQYNCGHSSIHLKYSLRTMSFLQGIKTSTNIILRTIGEQFLISDIMKLALWYNTDAHCFSSNYKKIILDSFYADNI